MTLQPEYEAAQIGVFGQMYLKGYIYRGLKSVHWSPTSQTALAEAELEYPEGHTSPSIYAAFPMVAAAEAAQAHPAPYLANWASPSGPPPPGPSPPTWRWRSILTSPTPWWKWPGKPFPYLLIAKDLRDRLSQVLGTDLTVKAEIKGADLEGCTYRHPLQDQLPTDKRGDTSPVIVGGDYITTESGTGLVHTAPGHGQEDFQVGQRYGLPVLCPVDERGTMTEKPGPLPGRTC
jgi:isoleucyl-tRNA synthetase